MNIITEIILCLAAGSICGLLTGKKSADKKYDKARKEARKWKDYFELFDEWLALKEKNKKLADYFFSHSYDTVAVYGMGKAGRHLVEELRCSGIRVVYGIDRKAGLQTASLPVRCIDDELPTVDVIVVTAVFAYEEIEEKLMDKINCPIISLEEVVYDCATGAADTDMPATVLFGAGKRSFLLEEVLYGMGTGFEYFADNNSELWGKRVRGRKVLSPEELFRQGEEYRIIISSTGKEEIEEQIRAAGMEGNLIDPFRNRQFQQKWMFAAHLASFGYLHGNKVERNKHRTILVDNLDSPAWGGLERWAGEVGHNLFLKGRKVKILTNILQKSRMSNYSELIEYVNYFVDHQWAAIRETADIMKKYLPFVLVDNRMNTAFMAALILKRYFPGDVKIITFCHCDVESYYVSRQFWQRELDMVAGVSLKICRTMNYQYKIPREKIYYRENFISDGEKYHRTYAQQNHPVRIGYAARLVAYQKKAEALPLLVDILEEKGIAYTLSIAGTGECYEMLEQYISVEGLEDRVKLLGLLDECEMPEFWKQQDIYINLSDYEGASLSMLEAMSYGVVPVVTDVSGAEEFVINGESGYRVGTRDWNQMADRIEELSVRRDKIEAFGKHSMDIVRKKCNKDEYTEFVEALVDGQGCDRYQTVWQETAESETAV